MVMSRREEVRTTFCGSMIRARLFISSIITVGLISANCARGGGSTAGSERASTEERITLRSRVEHLDTLVREPMIAEHKSGALFVTGYNRRVPALWRSTDGGTTWKRVEVGGKADGAIGNSDVDLAVANDGTLYFVAMSYDRHREPPVGTQISIGVSQDEGASWRWTMLSHTLGDDRPWVAVAPNGTAHVIWNDGHGVNHAISRDRGSSWTRMGRVPIEAAQAISRSGRTGRSPYALGRVGERQSLRQGCRPRGRQRGRRRELAPVRGPGQSATQRLSRRFVIVNPAVGRSGRVGQRRCAVHAVDHRGGVWLAQSENKGATWTTCESRPMHPIRPSIRISQLGLREFSRRRGSRLRETLFIGALRALT